MAAGNLSVINTGAICVYRNGDSAVVVQLEGSGSAGGSVPFLEDPGSHLVTVDGVKASWRDSTSARRSSILALKDHGMILQVTLSPSVSNPMAKAEKVMTEILQRM
jgi:hypothetical protein